jgi:hypothetical protein
MYNHLSLQIKISPDRKITSLMVFVTEISGNCMHTCTQTVQAVHRKNTGIQKSSNNFCSISPALGADFQSASG